MTSTTPTRFATILAELSDPTRMDDANTWNGHSPFALASLADCMSPDNSDSPGARFLSSIARDVADYVNNGSGDPRDDRLRLDALTDGDVAQIADVAVPIYTHERWATFVDLGAYSEDVSDLAGPDSDLTERAGMALYIIAERLVQALAEELSEALDEDDDTDEDETFGTFTDLATGERSYPARDGAGRIHLTRASGTEVGNGFDTVEEMHAYVLNFGLTPDA